MITLHSTAAVFLTALGGCLLIGRGAIRALARAQCLSQARYENCPSLLAYHETKPQVPTMGGVFVLGVAGVIAAAFGGLRHPHGWLVLLAIAGLGAVGLFDDWFKCRRLGARGMRSGPKLLAALGVGAAVGGLSAAGPTVQTTMPLPGIPGQVELGGLWVPFAMLVIAGSAHAVNLTDGMDGLATGCLAIAFSVLGVWALPDAHSHALVAWCAALAGACVGFLWFNSFPASVFLGDVGALGLGAALGTISLLTHSALWLVIIGGVFVVEALSVMLQVASYKWRNKRRIFRVAPLHHHFHLGGTSEPKLIVRFWIIGMMLALLGLTRVILP